MADYFSTHTGVAVDAGIDTANAALPKAGGTIQGNLNIAGELRSDPVNGNETYSQVLRGVTDFGDTTYTRSHHISGSHFEYQLNVGSDAGPDNALYLFYSTGNAYAPVGWLISSSIEVKEDLCQLTGALDKIGQLTAYNYARTDVGDTARRHNGLIAEDVARVLPDAVSERDVYDDPKDATKITNKVMAYDPAQVVALLVEAVKELRAEVIELKASG